MVLETSRICIVLVKQIVNARRDLKVLVQAACKQRRIGHKGATQLHARDRQQPIGIPVVEGSGKPVLHNRKKEASLHELRGGIRRHLATREISGALERIAELAFYASRPVGVELQFETIVVENLGRVCIRQPAGPRAGLLVDQVMKAIRVERSNEIVPFGEIPLKLELESVY